MALRPLALALLLAALAGPLAAAEPEPVALAPLEHSRASLTVVARDGAETVYAPADLERLPTYRMVTTTPWREVPAAFEGVLLRDLLAAHGLEGLDAVEVTAENDYVAVIERVVWETTPVLVATRVDGRPHSRRARGPIQFVIDWDAYRAHDPLVSERHMVWMAARIAPAN